MAGTQSLLSEVRINYTVATKASDADTYDDPFNADVMVMPSAFETQLRLYELD